MTIPTVTDVLVELVVRGIQIRVVQDRLRFSPKSAMTPELAEHVKRLKGQLVTLLRVVDIQAEEVRHAEPTVKLQNPEREQDVARDSDNESRGQPPSPPSAEGHQHKWSPLDLVGSERCAWCGGPIVFGKIDSDTSDRSAIGKWMALDPDLMPHHCPMNGMPRNKTGRDGATE